MKILIYKPAEKYQLLYDQLNNDFQNNIYFAVTRKDLFILAKLIQPEAILVGESEGDFDRELMEKLPEKKIYFIDKNTILSEMNLNDKKLDRLK